MASTNPDRRVTEEASDSQESKLSGPEYLPSLPASTHDSKRNESSPSCPSALTSGKQKAPTPDTDGGSWIEEDNSHSNDDGHDEDAGESEDPESDDISDEESRGISDDEIFVRSDYRKNLDLDAEIMDEIPPGTPNPNDWIKGMHSLFTPGKLEATHQHLTRTWSTSLEAAVVRFVLTTCILANPNVTIDRVVFVGLGGLTKKITEQRPNGQRHYPVHPEDNIAQLVAVEDWLATLRRRHHIGRVIFLEPEFRPEDKSFLEQKGYEAPDVEDVDDVPEGFVTPTTFLFAPFAPGHKYIENGQPAAYVGTSLSDLIARDHNTATPALETFMTDKKEWAIPAETWERRDEGITNFVLYYPGLDQEQEGVN